MNYLIEAGFKVVAEVAVGPFQFIVEGVLCGGDDDAIFSADSDGVSDIQSIVLAGGCNLITCELIIVSEEVEIFGASIFIGEELSCFGSWKHDEARI